MQPPRGGERERRPGEFRITRSTTSTTMWHINRHVLNASPTWWVMDCRSPHGRRSWPEATRDADLAAAAVLERRGAALRAEATREVDLAAAAVIERRGAALTTARRAAPSKRDQAELTRAPPVAAVARQHDGGTATDTRNVLLLAFSFLLCAPPPAESADLEVMVCLRVRPRALVGQGRRRGGSDRVGAARSGFHPSSTPEGSTCLRSN